MVHFNVERHFTLNFELKRVPTLNNKNSINVSKFIRTIPLLYAIPKFPPGEEFPPLEKLLVKVVFVHNERI